MSLKSRVEAVLFLTDKPLVAAVVAKLVNEDVQLVRQAIMQLIFDYEQRDCALEISDDDDGYMMQVKDQYANLANDLAPIDLPVAVIRTLSAIAIKQPVMQSEIVRIRGAGAYEHITTLLEKELITKREEGRSPLLTTTKKFQEYFRLSQDAKALRTQLKESDKEEKAGDLDQQLELPLEGDNAVVAAEVAQLDAAQANIQAQELTAQLQDFSSPEDLLIGTAHPPAPGEEVDASIEADPVSLAEAIPQANEIENAGAIENQKNANGQSIVQSAEIPGAAQINELTSEKNEEQDESLNSAENVEDDIEKKPGTIIDTKPTPRKTRQESAGVADWSDSPDRPSKTAKANTKSKKAKADDNAVPITSNQVIASPTVN